MSIVISTQLKNLIIFYHANNPTSLKQSTCLGIFSECNFFEPSSYDAKHNRHNSTKFRITQISPDSLFFSAIEMMMKKKKTLHETCVTVTISHRVVKNYRVEITIYRWGYIFIWSLVVSSIFFFQLTIPRIMKETRLRRGGITSAINSRRNDGNFFSPDERIKKLGRIVREILVWCMCVPSVCVVQYGNTILARRGLAERTAAYRRGGRGRTHAIYSSATTSRPRRHISFATTRNQKRGGRDLANGVRLMRYSPDEHRQQLKQREIARCSFRTLHHSTPSNCSKASRPVLPRWAGRTSRCIFHKMS